MRKKRVWRSFIGALWVLSACSSAKAPAPGTGETTTCEMTLSEQKATIERLIQENRAFADSVKFLMTPGGRQYAVIDLNQLPAPLARSILNHRGVENAPASPSTEEASQMNATPISPTETTSSSEEPSMASPLPVATNSEAPAPVVTENTSPAAVGTEPPVMANSSQRPLPQPPKPGLSLLANYRARLSKNDHLNRFGMPLNSLDQIIRQDRANYYAEKPIRDAEDEPDTMFQHNVGRTTIPYLARNLTLKPDEASKIVNQTPLIEVSVWSDQTMTVQVIAP